MNNDKILEIIQSEIWDKDIQLDDQTEKAVYLAIKYAYSGAENNRYTIEGEPEDCQRFESFVKSNAPLFKVILRG